MTTQTVRVGTVSVMVGLNDPTDDEMDDGAAAGTAMEENGTALEDVVRKAVRDFFENEAYLSGLEMARLVVHVDVGS